MAKYGYDQFLKLCEMYSDRGYDYCVKQAKESVKYIENMVGSRRGRTTGMGFILGLMGSIAGADGYVTRGEWRFFCEVTGYNNVSYDDFSCTRMDLIERGVDPDFFFMDEWKSGNYDEFYLGCQMLYLGLCTAACDGRINEDEAKYLYLSVPAPEYND